jgi:hypothetical protein
MKRLAENQCRRCDHTHEELLQIVDPQERWAVLTVHCHCGHEWTIIQTAPANLHALRSWIAHGCVPLEGPLSAVRGAPWHRYRLEGVSPAPLFQAS